MMSPKLSISKSSISISLICIILILGIKLIRNDAIYKSNLEQLNNLNIDCSASCDEFKDLLKTMATLSNLNIKDIELLNSKNLKTSLESINSYANGLIILYFPKTICEQCIQSQIEKVLNTFSSRPNFFYMMPLNLARELLTSYKNINKEKVLYYDSNALIQTETMKPIVFHVNHDLIIDKSFVLQKINVEYNDIVLTCKW